MSLQVEMPHVGESVTEAVIGKWLKSEGDRVEKYDPIVEVVTDKVSMEVPAPAGGTLTRLVAQEGETVQMGDVIAEMDADDKPAQEAKSRGEVTRGETGPDAGRIGELITGANVGPTGGEFTDTSLSGSPVGGPDRPVGAQQQPGTSNSRRYSPVVVRLASEHGIDLSTVSGTGLGGRVTKKDVEAAIASGAESASSPKTASATRSLEARREKPTPVRRMIADHMTKSWSEIPHAWSAIEVDVTGMVECRRANRESVRRRAGVDLTYLPMTLSAVANAVKAHELLNSSWQDGEIEVHGNVHVGIAVAAPGGLVVPVIRDADGKSVVELAGELTWAIQRAREGKLDLSEVQGGTFTLNNTGALGSVWGGAIINHPQAAILTTEAIVKRPVVLEAAGGDSIAVRSMMNVCLSFDHRIIDGAEASEFLQDVRMRLEAFSSETDLT